MSGFINSPLRPSLRLIDSIERLQSLSGMCESEWLDLLGLTWTSYYSFRSGMEKLPYSAVENVADHFDFKILDLFIHKIDFQKIAQIRTSPRARIPERYLTNAHGRLRSVISPIESLEQSYGWRLKSDVIKRFQLFETSLMNALGPVSIQLITDICQYLSERQFGEKDFFKMGTFAYQSNRNSIVGAIFSELANFRDAFEMYATSLRPLFGENFFCDFQMKDHDTRTLNVRSNPDIASKLNVEALGSKHFCQIKAGNWASLLSYFQMSLPQVSHPECEHRGDSSCRFVFDFSGCQKLSDSAYLQS